MGAYFLFSVCQLTATIRRGCSQEHAGQHGGQPASLAALGTRSLEPFWLKSVNPAAEQHFEGWREPASARLQTRGQEPG